MTNNLNLNKIILLLLFFTGFSFFAGANGVGNNIFGYLVNAGRFDDFFNIFYFSKKIPGPNESFQLTSFIIFLARQFDSHRQIVLLASLLVGIFVPLILIFKELKNTCYKESVKIIVMLVISYPFIFSFFRGNPILPSFLWTICGIIFFSKKSYNLAITSITSAALIHPTGAIFGLIFLSKSVSLFCKVFLSIFLTQILFYYLLDFSLMQTLQNQFLSLGKYKQDYLLGGGGDLYNNSLFILCKVISENEIFLNACLILIPTILLITLAIRFLKFCKHFNYKAAIIFCGIYYLPIYIILSSPVSADYKLLYILIPLFFMILVKFYNWPFVILLISILPKHFIFFSSYWLENYPNSILVYAGLLKSIGLTSNSLVNPIILTFAFYSSEKHIILFFKEIENLIIKQPK